MRDTGVVIATLSGAAIVVIVLMSGVLVWVWRTGTATVVDAVWGAGCATVAVTGLIITWDDDGNGLRTLVAVLTAVWGVRLTAHIARRIRDDGEDRRYVELFSRHRGNRVVVAAIWVCVPQGAALWFVSLPVQLVQASTATLGWWAAAGTAVWVIGFAFEAVGDRQLARFRADPARRGGVLSDGMWRYTRHPNYFGDACVWWGLYLCACSAWPAAFTVASPVAMTLALTRGTGKRQLERYLERRPEYAEYVRRTSGFVPLPPRR